MRNLLKLHNKAVARLLNPTEVASDKRLVAAARRRFVQSTRGKAKRR